MWQWKNQILSIFFLLFKNKLYKSNNINFINLQIDIKTWIKPPIITITIKNWEIDLDINL